MNRASARPGTTIGQSDLLSGVLALGVAIPAIYLGIQLAAAPFHPGYSFFARDASSLGSSGSTAPWIFNVGTLLLGIFQVAAAGAFLIALPRAGVSRALAAVAALALASSGVGGLNAFLHPLPDPRHSAGLLAILGGGFVLLPPATAAILWRLGARRSAVVTLLGSLVVMTVMSSLIQRACMATGSDCAGYQFFLNNYHGLIQRAGAAVVFVPVGVIAHLLRRGRMDEPRERRPIGQLLVPERDQRIDARGGARGH